MKRQVSTLSKANQELYYQLRESGLTHQKALDKVPDDGLRICHCCGGDHPREEFFKPITQRSCYVKPLKRKPKRFPTILDRIRNKISYMDKKTVLF
jgi:hypothetical protein